MSDMNIKSYVGEYFVHFTNSPFDELKNYDLDTTHFICDSNVYNLYKSEFEACNFDKRSILLIEATEENKDFDKIGNYVDFLLERGIKRNQTLVAIGGGIIQDITCFIADVLFRGIRWDFFPTTLLAQSDSCIGSKSSINYRGVKNLVGSFYPPKRIILSTSFQKTLENKEIKSGIGEIIKVHLLAGSKAFGKMKEWFPELDQDTVMEKALRSALEIKKTFIEMDEFDKGPRNVMNYGHSFGHAIESATKYGIPHGIAVTIGMDMANYFAFKQGSITEDIFEDRHSVLKMNYQGYENHEIPMNIFLKSIAKDKKNEGNNLALIVPVDEEKIEKVFVPKGEMFTDFCEEYFSQIL